MVDGRCHHDLCGLLRRQHLQITIRRFAAAWAQLAPNNYLTKSIAANAKLTPPGTLKEANELRGLD